MIKLERFEVMNMNNAIRGARNPLNSWARMDSYFDEEGKFVFGPNDLDLAKRLCKAGSDHRKFIRQIFVTVDITAPLYWWKEYDTYKVGTVANSTSTMHKIHSKPFEMSDFSTDHMTDATLDMMQKNIALRLPHPLRAVTTSRTCPSSGALRSLPRRRKTAATKSSTSSISTIWTMFVPASICAGCCRRTPSSANGGLTATSTSR